MKQLKLTQPLGKLQPGEVLPIRSTEQAEHLVNVLKVAEYEEVEDPEDTVLVLQNPSPGTYTTAYVPRSSKEAKDYLKEPVEVENVSLTEKSTNAIGGSIQDVSAIDELKNAQASGQPENSSKAVSHPEGQQTEEATIALINKAESAAEVGKLIVGDDRQAVKDAAKKRLSDIKAKASQQPQA